MYLGEAPQREPSGRTAQESDFFSSKEVILLLHSLLTCTPCCRSTRERGWGGGNRAEPCCLVLGLADGPSPAPRLLACHNALTSCIMMRWHHTSQCASTTCHNALALRVAPLACLQKDAPHRIDGETEAGRFAVARLQVPLVAVLRFQLSSQGQTVCVSSIHASCRDGARSQAKAQLLHPLQLHRLQSHTPPASQRIWVQAEVRVPN